MSTDSLYQEELYLMPPKVLIILSQPWDTLAEADKTLLARILASVKLALSQVQIISGTQVQPEHLSAYAPQKVLIFGKVLASSHQLYENFTAGSYPTIAADELHVLDDARKKSLWLAMKQLFL